MLAVLDGDDVILCQITSQASQDRYTVPISDVDFDTGSLKRPSNVRPSRIFTADSHIILYRVGHLKNNKLNEVVATAVSIIRG